MSSSHHHQTPSFPPSNDPFWDAPRLYKDKIHRDDNRPVKVSRPPPPRHVAVAESPKRVQLLDYKSKSSTSVPTLRSLGTRLSPTGSVDMSMSRFSLDGTSLYSQIDRPESIAQNLRAKGSRLMRRQNSKFNLPLAERFEDTNERWARNNARDNKIRSPGNGKHRDPVCSQWILLIAVCNAGSRPDISEPYNFQHLTHTHSRHFQQMSRTSHHDLVSEFSAIRASQAPRRELQGIKADSLQSRALQSEPTSPARHNFMAPPLCPGKATHGEPTRSPGHQYAHSVDYSSEPAPRLYKGHSQTAIAPPPRSSSRAAVPDFFTHHHEDPYITPALSKASYLSEDPSLPDENMGSTEYPFLPHAVTTPDNSAFTLRSPPFRVPRPELPDVPEEDDDEKAATSTFSRPTTGGSSLRHAKSFPSIRTNPQSCTPSPRKEKVRDSGSQYPEYEKCLSQSEIMLPLVGEPDDDIPDRPRFSRRVSLKAQGFDACWEDDIDYCYQHAAEADCDFDWDRVSVKDTHNTEDPTTIDVEPLSESCQNLYEVPSPDDVATHHLPRLQTSVPSLCSADSAKSSSFSSIAGPATPSYPPPSPRLYGPPTKTSARTSANYALSPPLLVCKDSSSTLHEEVYESMFLNKHDPNEPLPLHTLRFDPPSSRDDSPRSSRSPLSKCNSQESFMISRSSSFRYPRSTDSIGSLPELVHSKSSHDGLSIPQEQALELAATLKASESLLDIQQNSTLAIRPKMSQSLAKEVARQSMLQKAASFGSFDEEEEHATEAVVVLPSVTHHERSQSAAVPQATGPTYAQRKRSKTSATASTKKRVSYSLFPSPPVRSP